MSTIRKAASVFVALPFMLAAPFFTPSPATARDYPWCAHLGSNDDLGTSCYFDSYEQCMATVSGIGGYCDENLSFQPPYAVTPSPRAPRGKALRRTRR